MVPECLHNGPHYGEGAIVQALRSTPRPAPPPHTHTPPGGTWGSKGGPQDPPSSSSRPRGSLQRIGGLQEAGGPKDRENSLGQVGIGKIHWERENSLGQGGALRHGGPPGGWGPNGGCSRVLAQWPPIWGMGPLCMHSGPLPTPTPRSPRGYLGGFGGPMGGPPALPPLPHSPAPGGPPEDWRTDRGVGPRALAQWPPLWGGGR